MQEAIGIDKENYNTPWVDAIKKKMANMRIALKILELEATTPNRLGQGIIKDDIQRKTGLCQKIKVSNRRPHDKHLN